MKNPEKRIEELINARGKKGMSIKQIVDHLASTTGQGRVEIRQQLRPVLKDLVRQGVVVVGRGKRYFSVEATEFVRGRLRMTASGFGLVQPEGKESRLVRVEKAGLRGALDRDLVVVRIETPRERARREQQREGVVVRVLERARTTVVGRWIEDKRRKPHVKPLDRKLGPRVSVSTSTLEGTPANGEFVVVAIERISATGKIRGRLVERIGMPEDEGVPDQVVLRSFGIEEVFPDDALAAAKAANASIGSEESKGRWDLREQPAATIDPKSARDFDDAVFAERGSKGAIVVDVHIADVTAYVALGNSLDEAARDRSTSVYLPQHVVPMLPERLSGDLCSLRPGEDRLAFTVRFEVGPDGRLGRSEARPSIIRSQRRCIYEEVAGWLDSGKWPDGDPGVSASLKLCAEAAERLYEDRRRRGGLDFDLAEPQLVFDESRVVVDVVPAPRTVAHRMIEELMVAANRVVAQMLVDRAEPALHRVHDQPDPRRLDDLAATLKGLGIKTDLEAGDVAALDLQSLLDQVAGKTSERLIGMLVLRSMARAVYSPEPRGHFALAAPAYCHFTSPIRRYPDIVAHRALKNILGFGKKTHHQDLKGLGLHCSDRERRAESAERMAKQWRIVMFLMDHVGDVFKGRVSGVTSFGLFVTLDRFAVDGLVHIADLVDDYYEYDSVAHTLSGQRSGRRFRLGDALEVKVCGVDEEAMQIQLLPASIRPDASASKKSRKSRGRRQTRKPASNRPRKKT